MGLERRSRKFKDVAFAFYCLKSTTQLEMIMQEQVKPTTVLKPFKPSPSLKKGIIG